MPIDDGLKPAREFKPPEFKTAIAVCPECGSTDIYQNGECVECTKLKETMYDREQVIIKKLPVKLRETKFTSMVQTPELLKIKDSLKKYADDRKSVYLHGSYGNGKTSLMALLFKYQARKGIVVDWANVPDLMESIRRSYGKQDDLIGRLISTGANGTLFLDDLGAERVKKDAEVSFVEEQLYRLVNGIYERNGHVMIISNMAPGGIAERVGERIVSRLVEMCVQIENTLPDYRLKNVRK